MIINKEEREFIKDSFIVYKRSLIKRQKQIIQKVTAPIEQNSKGGHGLKLEDRIIDKLSADEYVKRFEEALGHMSILNQKILMDFYFRNKSVSQIHLEASQMKLVRCEERQFTVYKSKAVKIFSTELILRGITQEVVYEEETA